MLQELTHRCLSSKAEEHAATKYFDMPRSVLALPLVMSLDHSQEPLLRRPLLLPYRISFCTGSVLDLPALFVQLQLLHHRPVFIPTTASLPWVCGLRSAVGPRCFISAC